MMTYGDSFTYSLSIILYNHFLKISHSCIQGCRKSGLVPHPCYATDTLEGWRYHIHSPFFISEFIIIATVSLHSDTKESQVPSVPCDGESRIHFPEPLDSSIHLQVLPRRQHGPQHVLLRAVPQVAQN